MSDCYLGEIRIFGGNFAPAHWSFCDGSLLSISQNEALYTLLGTTYGGDGITTFALPDLRGRVPVHPNPTIPQGSKAGTESVTLLQSQLPAHTHTASATNTTGDLSSPQQAIWSASSLQNYANNGTLVSMHPQSLSIAGNNLPHDNMMPSLAISFIIALAGVYPSRP